MTTLNTIIEEEKKEFDEKFQLLNYTVSEGHGATDKAYIMKDIVRDFLTSAMQRAYEQAVNDYENARDDDSCECDNCRRWNKFRRNRLDQLKKEISK